MRAKQSKAKPYTEVRQEVEDLFWEIVSMAIHGLLHEHCNVASFQRPIEQPCIDVERRLSAASIIKYAPQLGPLIVLHLSL